MADRYFPMFSEFRFKRSAMSTSQDGVLSDADKKKELHIL